MVLFGGALGLAALAVWIFCIIDVVTTPAAQVRNLPKLAWIAAVVLLVDIGSIAWLVAGRPWTRVTVPSGDAADDRSPARRQLSGRPRPVSPDDDEEFLAALSRQAEEERRRRSGEDPGPDDSA